MPLDGMKKDADIVYKLKIQGEYKKQISARSRSQILDLERKTGKLSDMAADHLSGKR